MIEMKKIINKKFGDDKMKIEIDLDEKEVSFLKERLFYNLSILPKNYVIISPKFYSFYLKRPAKAVCGDFPDCPEKPSKNDLQCNKCPLLENGLRKLKKKEER
jgi:hypothetical protein